MADEEKEEERLPQLHIKAVKVDVPEELAQSLPEGSKALGCEIHWEGDIMTMASMLAGAALKEPHIRMTLETVVEFLQNEHPMDKEEVRDEMIKKMAEEVLGGGGDPILSPILERILNGKIKPQGDA